MKPTRRYFLKATGALAALMAVGIITENQALALENSAAVFEAKTLSEVLAALGGTPVSSAEIILTTPDIAENGAVVPVSVSSTIPNTQEIYILVEHNPNPASAGFIFPEGTLPYVQTRIKMGQTANVTAIVKADGKLYSFTKETKVTLGGCGG
jgi:sulfur-oxidizing protein SoxY